MRRFLTLFILFSLSLSAISQQKSEYNIPFAPTNITSGDIDLDGDIDLVVGHKYNLDTEWSGITILRNQNSGYYLQIDSLNINASQYGHILVENFDNNPYLEIIGEYYDENNNYESYLCNYQNNSDTFELLPLNIYSSINYKKAADIDNNNLLDIVFSTNAGQLWGVLYNNGEGTFSTPEIHFETNTHPTDIDCGDLNGDGRDDVLLSGNKTLIYYSDTSGFTPDTLHVISYGAEIVDFDLDGDNDIIIFSPLGFVNTYFYYYENNNNHEFTLINTGTLYNRVIDDILVSDFDNNGYPDIACLTVGSNTIPASESGLYIYYNQGGEYIVEPQFIQIQNYGESYRHFHCNDFDGNNYNDIAITRSLFISDSGYNLSILFNDGKGNFLNSPQTDISNIKNNNQILTCYPNPFNNQITFKINNLNSNKVQLRIHNNTGKLITTLNHRMITGKQTEIQLSELQDYKDGFYFATLLIDHTVVQTIKLIKTNLKN